MACGSMRAGRVRTVVDVLTAVVTGPAIDTDTMVATHGVQTRAPILTGIGHQIAFIHIRLAKLTRPFRLALAVVGVHTIHAHTPIFTTVLWAVIDVVLTVVAIETW